MDVFRDLNEYLSNLEIDVGRILERHSRLTRTFQLYSLSNGE